MSKTLVEHHFSATHRFGNRTAPNEQIMWTYIVQIASAMKAVHGSNLAVRCIDASKVILTEKNRIRLNACSILDVIHFEANRPIPELQQEDFIHFGKLILSIASNNLNINLTAKISIDHLLRAYTQEFRSTVVWLLTPVQPPAAKNINEFLASISGHLVTSFDNLLHAEDTTTSYLMKELENGRLFRLMAKLGAINERPEYEGDVKWSEYGERYVLKLFRDYVFHQVDENGKPVVDLGHMVACLNKLDAGSADQIKLVSRDDQDCIIVSYKELKKQVQLAFDDLTKPSPTKGRY